MTLIYVNNRFSGLEESATLAVKTKAGELRAAGRTIIDLSAGEPDIDTPEHIKEAARVAMSEGRTKYTPVPGIPQLREAVAEKYSRLHGSAYSVKNVIVANGGKQAIYELLSVVLEPGMEVIVPSPFWVSYPPMVELAGGTPVLVKTSAENSYRITPEQLEASLTPRTRVVALNSPSNPTGMGYPESSLKALGEVVLKAIRSGRCPQLLVLSDEVYEHLCFPHFQFSSFGAAVPELHDRTITVSACSKSYSMTGWRVGFAAGPAPLIAAMSNYQSQTTSNVCSIAQYAGLAAIKGTHDFIAPMIENFSRRTTIAKKVIDATPGLELPDFPDGAFYLFVRIDELIHAGVVRDSLDFASRLLETAGVAVVPGGPFGDDAAFRMSTSSSDSNVTQGIEKIAEAVRSFQSQ